MTNIAISSKLHWILLCIELILSISHNITQSLLTCRKLMLFFLNYSIIWRLFILYILINMNWIVLYWRVLIWFYEFIILLWFLNKYVIIFLLLVFETFLKFIFVLSTIFWNFVGINDKLDFTWFIVKRFFLWNLIILESCCLCFSLTHSWSIFLWLRHF